MVPSLLKKHLRGHVMYNWTNIPAQLFSHAGFTDFHCIWNGHKLKNKISWFKVESLS